MHTTLSDSSCCRKNYWAGPIPPLLTLLTLSFLISCWLSHLCDKAKQTYQKLRLENAAYLWLPLLQVLCKAPKLSEHHTVLQPSSHIFPSISRSMLLPFLFTSVSASDDSLQKKALRSFKAFFPHILDPNKSQLLHWLISIPKILQHYIARDLGIQSSFSQCTEPESGVEGTATAVTFSCYNKDAISSLLSGCHLWSIFWFFYWCGISLCKKSYFLSTGAILKQFKWLLLAQILKLEIKQWI